MGQVCFLEQLWEVLPINCLDLCFFLFDYSGHICFNYGFYLSGRRFNCILYGVLYGLGCVTKVKNENVSIILFGLKIR